MMHLKSLPFSTDHLIYNEFRWNEVELVGAPPLLDIIRFRELYKHHPIFARLPFYKLS